ncbi:uncharacterized protein K452DRAFT_361427 [Aplosporella prunicola CBS 121167]|uniref:nicotinamidase n=1 Tax=Aplosporella prunicola CBS 121167 TaxID=1176127 RepID=A0A6A6B4P8_9PEZI|nr:uncharacterized protein K452DRAFT_361427 [Aplosporella prunicola CBS 121167]KAF2138373.1 hypothetical protein K452DRAFT_361427 [Aplosporella prunicola CBS 121167]
MSAPKDFKPALIVVDVQEDFCPPNGALAVPDGRAILPTINALLGLPFVLKIASADAHPANHVSFAANHPAPANEPFVSTALLANPANPAETARTRLWPVHCVAGTAGAALVPDLDTRALDAVVRKGQDPDVEMYSAFGAAWREPRAGRTELARLLRERNVSHVFVTGLALDYCVRCTAVDASEEGFVTLVVREGTRAVEGDKAGEVERELEGLGVRMVSMEGEEVGWVKAMAAAAA